MSASHIHGVRLAALCRSPLAFTQPASEPPVHIRLTADPHCPSTVPQDNATARDFAVLLSASPALSDCAKAQKISDSVWDAPWGDPAVLYTDASSARSPVCLVRIPAGLKALSGLDGQQVRIERAGR